MHSAKQTGRPLDVVCLPHANDILGFIWQPLPPIQAWFAFGICDPLDFTDQFLLPLAAESVDGASNFLRV